MMASAGPWYPRGSMPHPTDQAVLVLAHGSRDQEARAEYRRIHEALAARLALLVTVAVFPTPDGPMMRARPPRASPPPTCRPARSASCATASFWPTMSASIAAWISAMIRRSSGGFSCVQVCRLASATGRHAAEAGIEASAQVLEVRDYAQDLTNNLLTGFPSLSDEIVAAVG